jgi:uncharacterized protein YecT (DUF1311 family)
MPSFAPTLFISSRRLLTLISASALVVALAACDSSKPATASAGARTADAGNATKHEPATACPSQEIAAFVTAFAEDPALQKTFTAERVDTAFVDMSAQPEPAESVETLSRETLRFPVMPNRAQQQKEGLRYREVSVEGDRALIALEIPDTDAQLLYTFRRDACWTLVKIVDPAFGKAFPGEAPPAAGAQSQETASASPAPKNGNDVSQGLSKRFAECMARAQGNIEQADCLTAERDLQDARLNKAYKALIGQLQGDRRDKMVEAQRAWVQLQQKDGIFEASVLDELGPMGSLQQVENETRAIGRRADLLERYLEISKL